MAIGTDLMGWPGKVSMEKSSLHIANDMALRNTTSGLITAVTVSPLSDLNFVFLAISANVFKPEMQKGSEH